jgi:hypothetical protein
MKFKRILHTALNEMAQVHLETIIGKIKNDEVISIKDDYEGPIIGLPKTIANFLIANAEKTDEEKLTLEQEEKLKNFLADVKNSLEYQKLKSVQAGNRAVSGNRAEKELIELIQKLMPKGEQAESVTNPKTRVSLNVNITINEQEIKNAGQTKVVEMFEKFGVEMKSFTVEIKNFNPIKYDIEVHQNTITFFNSIDKVNYPSIMFKQGDKIEVKDVSKTSGQFIFAEVFKVSKPKLAERINKNDKIKNNFNNIVVEINEKLNFYINNKLSEAIGDRLNNHYLATRESGGWNIKKVEAQAFVRDLTAKVNNSYFQGINRVNLYFEDPPPPNPPVKEPGSSDESYSKEIYDIIKKRIMYLSEEEDDEEEEEEDEKIIIAKRTFTQNFEF